MSGIGRSDAMPGGERGGNVAAAYYIRVRGQVSGPYPSGLLVRFRTLGRLSATDEVSSDRREWGPVADCPALKLPEVFAEPAPCDDEEVQAWREERRRAALRWIEERSDTDRRHGESRRDGTELRSGQERRADPRAPRRCFGTTLPGPVSRIDCNVLLVLGALIGACVVSATLWWIAPHNALKVPTLRPQGTANQPPSPSAQPPQARAA